MFTARVSPGLDPKNSDIVVVGEQTLFVLTENGALRSQKRLDHEPSCAFAYDRGAGEREGDSRDNLVVCSFTEQMLVFKATRLMWSARTAGVVSNVVVSDLGPYRGMIVTLTEDGNLTANYLGTDALVQAVIQPDTKALDYEAVEREHRSLLNVIRSQQSSGGGTGEPMDRVTLKAQAGTILDEPAPRQHEPFDPNVVDAQRLVRGPQGGLISFTVRLYVAYSGNGVLPKVHVTVNCPECLYCAEPSVELNRVRGVGSTPLMVPITFYATSTCIPTDLVAKVTASHLSETGEPRVATCDIDLPFALACELTPPVKSSSYKLTIETDQPPAPLLDLFGDLLQQPGLSEEAVGRIAGGGSAMVLSFRFYVSAAAGAMDMADDGAAMDAAAAAMSAAPMLDASILVSKNGGRYRVQSSHLSALWTIVSQLAARLQMYWEAQGETVSVGYSDKLPLQDLFAMIDEHHLARVAINSAVAKMNDLSHQFRIIEKRLLVRFKDRNPVSLAVAWPCRIRVAVRIVTVALDRPAPPR